MIHTAVQRRKHSKTKTTRRFHRVIYHITLPNDNMWKVYDSH